MFKLFKATSRKETYFLALNLVATANFPAFWREQIIRFTIMINPHSIGLLALDWLTQLTKSVYKCWTKKYHRQFECNKSRKL